MTSFAQLSFSGLIDMGFVLLVAASCIVSLRAGDGGSGKADRWREELRDLQNVLKGLIDEASAASSHLDRRLLQRKQELETLLGKLEASQALLTSEQAPAPPRKMRTAVPNASERPWTLGDSFDETSAAVDEEDRLAAIAQSTSDRVQIAQPKKHLTRAGAIASALAAARARGAEVPQLAPQSQPQQQPRQQTTRSAAPTLSNQVEVTDTIEDEAERATYERLSIVDPGAYRIARRLLAAGKEIHVVARKLELPVSEVRLLDRLMRQEKKEHEHVEAEEELPVTHIVRTRDANGAAETSEQEETKSFSPLIPKERAERTFGVDAAIEREIALL